MIPSPNQEKTASTLPATPTAIFNGTVYVPNAPVTYAGNSSASTPGCFQLIAYAVTFSGNTKLDNSKCNSDGAATLEVQVCAFGAMMRKLDQRGVAALEFCLVAVPLFILMFAIFDLGRYAITMQSLRMLANAGARAVMIML